MRAARSSKSALCDIAFRGKTLQTLLVPLFYDSFTLTTSVTLQASTSDLPFPQRLVGVCTTLVVGKTEINTSNNITQVLVVKSKVKQTSSVMGQNCPPESSYSLHWRRGILQRVKSKTGGEKRCSQCFLESFRWCTQYNLAFMEPCCAREDLFFVREHGKV